MMEEIKDNDILIAKIIRNHTFEQGLKFFSQESDFLQIATWNYDKGKHLKAHGHKIFERQTSRTNEFLFIKTGMIKAMFYSEENALIKEIILAKGDIVIIFSGGHAYDILEDNTQVLEIKNGPYPGLENDKRVIEV